MGKLVTGLHHVTALASDPQKSVEFYSGILGLRFVKKTVNFDAPEIYHLYFGNEVGSPGTLITFFPYPTIPRGQKGTGQLTVVSFSISENSLAFWKRRLEQFNITYEGPFSRFDDIVLYFEDHDGLGLELVANKSDSRPQFTYGQIPLEHAIHGLYGITLSEECYEKTANLLTKQLDHVLVGEMTNRVRFAASNQSGAYVDILCTPDALKGIMGQGTVHHVAFITANEATQLEAREKLITLGLNVTPVLDRKYFHSIYFREPGGVLFEIATIPPGFTVDEPLEHLGESLQLPSWEESYRSKIENILPPISSIHETH